MDNRYEGFTFDKALQLQKTGRSASEREKLLFCIRYCCRNAKRATLNVNQMRSFAITYSYQNFVCSNTFSI